MMKQHHHPFHLGDCDHKTWHVVREPPSDTLVSRHNDSNGALCEDHPYILHFVELQIRLPLQHRQVIKTLMCKERGTSTCLMEVHVYSIVRFCLMNIVLDCVFCSGPMLILILLVVVLVKHFNFVPFLLLVITIVLEAVGGYL